GEFDEGTLNALRASPDMKSIEEDNTVEPEAPVAELGSPWGLSRISQDVRVQVQGSACSLAYTYRYDTSAGTGVDIYIFGINTTHVDFGGRARLGPAFGSPENIDDSGHGTHVAGIAAGTRCGVAKSANLIAVKVLWVPPGVSISISALDYVAASATASGRPTVINMSLSTAISPALDSATTAITGRGIHVAAAAGNQTTDASNRSPARVPSVNTVAASNISDARYVLSNYGPLVDLFAPGEQIPSAWIGSNTAERCTSGTSMASPHIAGLIAYFIGRGEDTLSAAAMSALLKQYTIKDAIDPSTLRTCQIQLHLPL
ncbi:peptidase S8/S53 domain-containing protein, partial [Amylostereum chailletii]